MRWEKSGDWKTVTAPLSFLSVPGEGRYFLWEHLTGRPRSLPKGSVGPEVFLLQCFVRMHELDQTARVNGKLYDTTVALTLARSIIAGSVDQDSVDQILTFFWSWHKAVDPSAIRPSGKAADEMQRDMEALKHVFENPEGLKIVPTG